MDRILITAVALSLTLSVTPALSQPTRPSTKTPSASGAYRPDLKEKKRNILLGKDMTVPELSSRLTSEYYRARTVLNYVYVLQTLGRSKLEALKECPEDRRGELKTTLTSLVSSVISIKNGTGLSMPDAGKAPQADAGFPRLNVHLTDARKQVGQPGVDPQPYRALVARAIVQNDDALRRLAGLDPNTFTLEDANRKLRTMQAAAKDPAAGLKEFPAGSLANQMLQAAQKVEECRKKTPATSGK